MKHTTSVLVCATQAEAEALSRTEAKKHFGETHTTELWWGWLEQNGEFLLLVPEGTPGAVEREVQMVR